MRAAWAWICDHAAWLLGVVTTLLAVAAYAEWRHLQGALARVNQDLRATRQARAVAVVEQTRAVAHAAVVAEAAPEREAIAVRVAQIKAPERTGADIMNEAYPPEEN